MDKTASEMPADLVLQVRLAALDRAMTIALNERVSFTGDVAGFVCQAAAEFEAYLRGGQQKPPSTAVDA